ncbi:MAG: HAD hydrolase-like protein, partial [bacterium]
MSTIIFDFDHTLINTSEITQMIMDIFLKNGVPEKTIYAIQKAQRSRNNDNPDLLAQIKDAESLGYKIDKKDINDFFNQDLEPLLKGPVKEILEKLVKDGHKLFLFTKGVEYFQRSKIRRSGIEEYFDENIYVFDSNKEETDVDI